MAWQHLMAQCAINISTEELNSSRRARVQEEVKHESLRCSMFIYPKVCGRIKWLQRDPFWCAFSESLKTWWNWYLFVCVCFWYMIFKEQFRLLQGMSHLIGLLMMMIAFITIKSNLVPLFEGLYAQIYCRFEMSVFCPHLLLFFFVKEKTC